jgi:DNA-binding response OmpR family regulator
VTFLHAHGQSLIVLVAEDETIIALDLQDTLIAAGYTVAETFATRSAALAWLEDHQPDGAIIDIILRDGLCTDLVCELTARGVPTLLYSGMNDIPDRVPRAGTGSKAGRDRRSGERAGQVDARH